MSIIARQYGFSNGTNTVDKIVDGDLATFWAPLQTDFSTYTDPFFVGDPAVRALNFGKPFPAIELDLGVAKRVTQIYVKVQSGLTLGPAVLVGSDSPASSPANTLQTGDVFLDEYTQQEIVSNVFLPVQAMKDADIKKRYLRLLQRSSKTSDAPPTGPANTFQSDIAGLQHFTIPEYSDTLTIEVWGGGASGGLFGTGMDGGDSYISKTGWLVTPTAGGGKKPTASVANAVTGAGNGGTATNFNTMNVNGNSGGVASNNTGLIGFSGQGGDAPFGGLGGIAIWLPLILGIGLNWRYGLNGKAPGGGGSGRNYWYPSGDVIYQKFVGGGSGSYGKHVLTRTSGDANPGSVIDFFVGAGGTTLVGDGLGANGRVKFSWT